MQIERVLQQKLDDTTEQIHRLEGSLSEKLEHGSGRGAVLLSHWEVNRASSLRDALSRIEQGTYSVCEQCGQPAVHGCAVWRPEGGLESC